MMRVEAVNRRGQARLMLGDYDVNSGGRRHQRSL